MLQPALTARHAIRNAHCGITEPPVESAGVLRCNPQLQDQQN